MPEVCGSESGGCWNGEDAGGFAACVRESPVGSLPGAGNAGRFWGERCYGRCRELLRRPAPVIRPSATFSPGAGEKGQNEDASSSPGAPGSASVGNSTCRRSKSSSPARGRRDSAESRQRQSAPQLGLVGGGFRTSASILD